MAAKIFHTFYCDVPGCDNNWSDDGSQQANYCPHQVVYRAYKPLGWVWLGEMLICPAHKFTVDGRDSAEVIDAVYAERYQRTKDTTRSG